jgi:alpha-2-macroglobulin
MRYLARPWTLFLLLLCCFACTTVNKDVLAKPGSAGGQVEEQQEAKPLQITLREGQKQDPKAAERPIAEGVPLAQARIEKLLEMFTEPLQSQKNRPEFFKRPGSKPAPRSATPKEMPFPPTTDGSPPPDVQAPELKVLSIAPEGALERAPRLSISFNTPMISVSDPASDEQGDPLGIKIEPRPEGKWRWLGTQTVIFEPKGAEFPRATDYKVTVPAGITDVNGSKLAEARTQSFNLPRPKVESFSPTSSGLGLEPLIYFVFDQPVEPETTLKLIHLKEGSQEVPIQQLTVSEAEALQKGVTQNFEEALKNRIFYFKAKQKLKPGTSYTLVVDKGIKSAEGPLLSQNAQTSGFSTYAPLTLSSRYPQEGEEVSPFNEFYLYFNNSLDEEKFDSGWVTVKPEIEHLKVRAQGGSIYIGGIKSGKTSYTVTVSPKLTDAFGQTLGKQLELTMKTGRAPKALSHGFQSFTLLDPTVEPGLPIYTTNIDKLDLLVHRVTPAQWGDYLGFLYEHQRAYTPEDRRKLRLPGEKVVEKSITLDKKPDQLVSTRVVLSDYFDDREGNLVVWVKDPTEDKENYRQREFFTWVQGGKLGLDVEIGSENVVALVTDLIDGKAKSGAVVRMGSSEKACDKDGLAVFPLPSAAAAICQVEVNGSSAFIPHSTYGYGRGEGWSKRSLSEQQQWFLFDDRGLYKPGEKAKVKGYVRAWQRGAKGQLTKIGQGDQEVSWVLNDPRGNKLKEGTVKLNAFSAVEIDLEFPPETNLGNHQLVLNSSGLTTGYHSLNVQEFRRPEFEVSTKVISDEPHLLLGSATIEATASYFAGGGLAGSDVNWSVSTSASSFTPPGRGTYTFGQWIPWWDLGCWWDGSRVPSGGNYYDFQGRADGQGTHQLGMDFVEMYPPRPTSVSATATVADVNRQQQASTTSVLVHPSERYVGLKAEKSFVDEKSDFEFKAIVTDIDGQMLAGIPVEIKLLKVEYEYSRSKGYHQIEKVVETQKITTSETPTDVKLSPKEGGTYRIKATVRDDKDRLNQTEYTFWKAGGELPSRDKVELENLTVVPDRKEYEPGQTARILVMAPFAEGEGMVVWSRDGLLREERFTLKNGTATLEQSLTDEMIPNIRAKITAVGKTKWGKRERPAVAAAELDLSISTKSRQLTIEIQPSKTQLEPGAEVDVPVVVKDHEGKPVAGSEVTLWIVDEAVLGLTGYTTPALLGAFYGHRPNQMTPHHNRTFIALADPEMAADIEEEERSMDDGAMPPPVASAPSGGARMAKRSRSKAEGMVMNSAVADEMESDKEYKAAPGQEPAAFVVRKNFDAMAIFKGDLSTDSSGRTSVKVKLPDNLTRYRIMSVAVKGDDKFGHGDSLLTARLPIMVRPSLPRFLNFGDKAKLPVVIQNQTDEPLSVDLVGEATGVTWLGAAGQTVKVPANDRVEVMFEAQADVVGKAHFRFGAVSGGFSDAATLSLPVYTPASGEAFATYGSVAENGAVKQPVRRPGDVWTQFGGLQISLSSTALSELTDAFLYLYEYPYECAEQKSSRILAIAAMREVLSAFNPEQMPTAGAIKSRMKADTLHLERMQNGDGGWEYWRRDEDSEPFVSLHVMHAMARAKVEGYEVNQDTLERGLEYLRDIESKCRAKKYGEHSTRSCMAYAMYVRNLIGDQDVAGAKSLFTILAGEKKDPNLEAIGWLWPTLSKHAKDSKELAELRRLVLNRATQTADKAQFSVSYGEGDGAYLLLHSSRRTDAILLAGLLSDEPKNQLNTKLVRGLLAHRTKGRWNNTQENIWILLALQSYFREYEKETPDFLASLWLDSGYLGEEKFAGRSAKEAQLNIPMAKLSDKDADLIVAKQGAGRLYYRIGMNYAPKSLRLPAENRGFLVERSYKGLDNAEDVTQLENGDWKVKAGAKIEVTLTMVAPERRYHVALVDQLPAGLEPLNPALKGTPPTSHGGSVSQSRSYYGWWWRWYEHENLRDERVECFGGLVYPGVYTYTYTALATTPGEYVLPPLKAEEMYSPEVFGRTATGRFVVE